MKLLTQSKNLQDIYFSFFRQLGYENGAFGLTVHNAFANVKSHFAMTKVECRGNEDRLQDCAYSTQSNGYADIDKQAGVVCKVKGRVLN